MVEISSKPVYICRLCKTEYSSFEEAIKCESNIPIPKYKLNQEVKIINTPNFDDWLPLPSGSHVPIGLYLRTEFNIDDIFIERGTHNIIYLIKEILNEDRINSLLRPKERTKEGLSTLGEDHPFYKNLQKDVNISDEEYIKERTMKFYLPEKCIKSLEEKIE